MGVTITVDLGTSSPKDIARAAKFMLEFAGYQEPSPEEALRAYRAATQQDQAAGAASGLVGARGSLGEPIDDNGPIGDAYKGVTFEGKLPETAIPDPAAAFGAAVASAAHAASFPPVDQQGVPIAGTFFSHSDAADTAAAATLPPPPPGIEVDAHGVPWDNRIHAGSRAKIADGTWRQKRNLDPEVYKKVMDELRHTMGVERRAPQPPAPPVPQEAFAPHPPVPPIPVAPLATHPLVPTMDYPLDTTSLGGARVLEPAPAPEVPPPPFAASAVPPAPSISSTPPVPASAGAATVASPGNPNPVTFPEFMKKVTTAFAAKTITQVDITRSCQKAGLTALPMLAMRPDLIGDVANELGIAL